MPSWRVEDFLGFDRRPSFSLASEEWPPVVKDDPDADILLLDDANLGFRDLFTGCSHNCILDMVETAVKRFPNVPIKAIFGGFHLIDLPLPLLAERTMAVAESEVRDVGKQILTYPVHKIYTYHCTGAKALRVLGLVMGEHLHHFPTGVSAEV